MTNHLQVLPTAEALDAEPEGSVVALFPSAAAPVLINTGKGNWLELDPYDRMDGEETTPSAALFNGASRRGRVIIKLWEPGQDGHGVIAGPDALDALPDGAIILQEQGDVWPKALRRTGGEWLELDPGDMSDGETTLRSATVMRIAGDDRVLHIFSPGSRLRAPRG